MTDCNILQGLILAAHSSNHFPAHTDREFALCIPPKSHLPKENRPDRRAIKQWRASRLKYPLAGESGKKSGQIIYRLISQINNNILTQARAIR